MWNPDGAGWRMMPESIEGTLFEPTACNVFISNENFNSYKFAAQDICLLLLIHATTALWVVQVKKKKF